MFSFRCMQSYSITLEQQKLCHCHFAILIAFPLSFAVETPSVTFAIENSPITNHSSLICAKGALKNMSVTLNTQLEELMFSSQIIYTWRRLRHQSKLYGVRLAQVFPTSTSPTCAVSLNIGGRTIWACAPRRSRWSNGWLRNTSRPSRCRCSVARSCPRSRIFPSPRPTIPVSSSNCGRSLSPPCRATRCPFSRCVTSLT